MLAQLISDYDNIRLIVSSQISGIIELLRSRNPSSAILVSKIIPISKRWDVGDHVEAFNKVFSVVHLFAIPATPKWLRFTVVPSI